VCRDDDVMLALLTYDCFLVSNNFEVSLNSSKFPIWDNVERGGKDFDRDLENQERKLLDFSFGLLPCGWIKMSTRKLRPSLPSW